LDENSRIICLGDLNKNFMGHLPNNVNDIWYKPSSCYIHTLLLHKSHRGR
jgi:hypothetical protein